MKALWSLTLIAGLFTLLAGLNAQDANRNDANRNRAQPDSKAVKEQAIDRAHAEWFEDGDESAKSLEEAAQKFLTKNDKNKDGKVTRDELPAHLQEGFVRIDRNKDGSLSSEELQKHAQRAMRAPIPVQVTEIWILDTHRGHLKLEELQEAYTLLSQIDADKDGKLTSNEVHGFEGKVATRMCERCFTQLDMNKDGKISREEAEDSMFEEDFTEIDANKDNQLTKTEVEKAVDSHLGSKTADTAAKPDDAKKE